MNIGIGRDAPLQIAQRMAEVVAQANLAKRVAHLLHVGAGVDVSIEGRIAGRPFDVVVDRLDVVDPSVDHEYVGTSWQCSVESMERVPSACYDGAFANWVLEHVGDVAAAGEELFRVLRPGGLFAATFPNPKAPEFRLAKHTPMWFHHLFERGHAHGTHYSYASVADLVTMFEASGFRTVELADDPDVQKYLKRVGLPLLPGLGSAYDALLYRLRWSGAMGQVLGCFAKP